MQDINILSTITKFNPDRNIIYRFITTHISEFISSNEAKEAKAIDIISTIKPQTEQLEGIKAPHFTLMVRNRLSKELGEAVVGRGGLTVKTTLDWRIQEKLETDMKNFFATGRPDSVRISNGAATIEDVQTGQIVALVGSRDFNYGGFGQDNAAASYIQPGSTIKSLVFAQLFDVHGGNQPTFGSGSVLSDENIDKLYGAQLRNWDNKFIGLLRSEERRVGKECRSRWSPYH